MVSHVPHPIPPATTVKLPTARYTHHAVTNKLRPWALGNCRKPWNVPGLNDQGIHSLKSTVSMQQLCSSRIIWETNT